jgi:hypothetical protein
MSESLRSKPADSVRGEDRRAPRRPVVEISLQGHLTASGLASELANATRLLCASSGIVSVQSSIAPG